MARVAFVFGLAGVWGFLGLNTLAAQEQREESPSQSVSRGFARGPAVGSPLAEVSAYDAEGQPFKLSSLKGHYSVLVFGCLT